MTAPADLHDRLAARLLGVDVDADPVVVRAAFRRLARAVHPDTAVADACVDLGRLAAAKDRLIARAEAAPAVARARILAHDRRRHDVAARERLLRARREQAAHQRLARLRLVDATPAVSPLGAAVPRRRSAPAGRLGLLVDLAG